MGKASGKRSLHKRDRKGTHMKVVMKWIRKTDGVFLNGKVEMFTKDSILKMNVMVLARWIGLMEVLIKGSGLMEFSMGSD